MRSRLPLAAVAAATVTALFLAACGGGGGADNNAAPAPSPAPAPAPAPTPAQSGLQPACSGNFCGASVGRYSGSGVGLWSYTNTGAQNASLSVDLQQLPQRPLLLVYTNTTAMPAAMPVLALQAQTQQRYQSQEEALDRSNHIPAMIRDFRPPALTDKADTVGEPRRAQSAALAPLGTQRSWYVSPDESAFQSRTATLQRQATASDGRTINLWLENSEAGSSKVTDAMLDTLLDRFARPQNSVYGMVTQLAGQPWGATKYSGFIGPDQPIDIVLVNFVPDGKPYGLLGYFWSLNNMQAKPGDSQLKYSNQSLSFYVDTETLYLDKAKGMDAQISTLAHEFVHMVNFYQRNVLQGPSYAFDTFLEEMTAVMMEDLLSDKLTPGANTARDGLVPSWLRRSTFNCDPTQWSTGSTCFGYDVVGAYGAYLLRQYGVGFYQPLLKNTSSSNSWAVLDNAITQAGGPGLAGTLARWGSSIALLPAAASPQGFGYPQRQDASGHLIPAIDGAALASARRLPTQLPGLLEGHGHFPFTRQPDAQGRYQEQLTVPPGVTLTVVAQ